MAATSVARFWLSAVPLDAAYAAAYNLLLRGSPAPAAPTRSPGDTAWRNTPATAAYFGIRGRSGICRQNAWGAVVYVLTLGLTAVR